MNGLLDFKSLDGAVRDVDMKNRVVTGYLSRTEVEDNHKDIMAKGAFRKSLNERRDAIFFLNQHNFSQPHGKFAVLREDDYGLYFESEPLVKGVTYSDDALKLYDAGILTEHSIGFVTTKAEDMENDVRLIKEVKLYEGSNVTIAANSGAKFMGLKNQTPEDINKKIKRIVAFMRKGDVTDETFVLLEYSLKELQTASFELGKKTLTDGEPIEDITYADVKPSIQAINSFINKF